MGIPKFGHQAIYDLSKKHKVMVATQNIDGLHTYLVSPNYQLVELHGCIQEMRCLSCRRIQPTDIQNPQCSLCKADCRPNIVLYGEDINPNKGGFVNWMAKYTDLVIIVGTTMSFEYLNHFVLKAKHHEAQVININPTMDYKYAHRNIKQTASRGLLEYIQGHL